ncbi:hypothetical protein CCACVL1_07764 [Corchorus capsularis]|uniref:Uncharacterized protein n=1 Tax=Corchorus capsularis TaxID=210143 RepID=A0A1R3J415_COCAP|nr:hypothetical protein CCACVL1_07764 [Corchorus capsularis]
MANDVHPSTVWGSGDENPAHGVGTRRRYGVLAMRIQLTVWEQEDGMGLGRNSKTVK